MPTKKKSTAKSAKPKQTPKPKAVTRDRLAHTNPKKEKPAIKNAAKGKPAAEKRPKRLTATQAYHKYGRQLKSLPGVGNISYGDRIKNDKVTSEPVIRLHVNTQEEKESLKKYLIDNSKKLGLKKSYGGVGIDIFVCPPFRTVARDAAKEGDWIESKTSNKHGTLTTKVLLQNPVTRAVWLMSAHVAANSKPTTPATIVRKNGSPAIGKVTGANYFREPKYDVAFIEPKKPLDGTSSIRSVVSLTKSDEGREVLMVGAVTPDFKGKIKLWKHGGTIGESPNEEDVENHFLIEGMNGSFVDEGDSGALVVMADDDSVAGIMRASDLAKFAIATKLSVASTELGFELAD